MGGGEEMGNDEVAAPAAMAEEEVMSEVHLGCPPRFSGPYISRFTFSISPEDRILGRYDGPSETGEAVPSVTLDDDGDLVVTRRKKVSVDHKMTIKHRIKSLIPSVGLQVWKAAMVLADFVLHTSLTSPDFHDVTALELGAGTGLVGILLARVAKMIFLTDYDIGVLDNCAANVHLNSSLFKHDTSVQVRKLDWKGSWPPNVDIHDSESEDKFRYMWSSSDIKEAEDASVLLAADVIYSDELTDSLFGVLESLMSKGCRKVLFLALEKRHNFSLSDLDVVANGYRHFRSFLKDAEGNDVGLADTSPCFVGEQIDLAQVPQYIKEYDRGKDLEIWKITCSPR